MPSGEALSVIARSYGTKTDKTSNGGITASTATEELDDLILSLNDYKLKDKSNENVGHEGEGCNKPSNLDAMLGDLHADMSKQGVKTTQKGVCVACMKPIAGQVVTALGKTWHLEVK